ncbi:fimbrillin family protein [uncultured Prevotella sp.]|uniref:fimbrillin family protein n=1 Tax=uncultured Prevotella sp. TaxID=159272 RepID=UPI00260524AE|nr:fimbrillin family protein [uncultured Prevotella sp.]
MKIHQLTASIAAVLLSASLFSCSSDDFLGKAETNTDGISFGVSTENGASTRANNSADGYTAARYTLRSDNSADTLCVRAVVTDGIGNSNAGRPATRAAMQTSMYNEFKVVAAVKENGNVGAQYYMDDVATKTGTNWVPSKVYYWPGSNRQLRFLAWAPTDASFQSVPNNPNATTLQYTTPAEAKNQRDIVAAATGFISNPSNDATCTPVGLQFKHLCTAVIIKTGEQMTAGTIKSVSLKGVKNSGTYDMVNSVWTLNGTTTDFTISPNQATTSTTPNGTNLNAGESTFMLLPQTLGADSKLEVAFHDNISGRDRILSASLNGAEWPMGKTVTYRLSITPEYELKFTSESKVQDAHYVIYPIKIKVDKNLKGGWTMKSNSSSVTLRKDLTDLEELGYWIEEDRGTQTITGTETGELTVYAFLEENIGWEKRNVVLELSPTGYPSAIPAKFTVTQLCPSWITDGLGCERIEDGDYQWGFLWDEGTNITYDLSKVHWFYRGALDLYLRLFTNYGKFITRDTWAFPKKITINFNEVKSPDVAKSATDGKKNTEELYNYNGVSEAAALMQLLERWGGIPDKTLPTNPTEFAVRAAVMKNKFNKEVKTTADGTIERPVLKAANLVWYLPAKDEYSKIKDYDYPLSGDYWTSTASEVDKDNDHSYKYTEGVGTSLEIRTTKFHVRAVRKK